MRKGYEAHKKLPCIRVGVMAELLKNTTYLHVHEDFPFMSMWPCHHSKDHIFSHDDFLSLS